MQESGLYADYRGRRLRVLFAGDDWVAVPAGSPGPGTDELPDAFQAGEGRQGPWVKLPKTSLSRYLDVTVWVEWRGEQFGVGKVSGDQVLLYGGSPDRAEELGLQGDQYNGFSVTVPLAEVSVVNVQEREIA